jgi:hypothetical protein
MMSVESMPTTFLSGKQPWIMSKSFIVVPAAVGRHYNRRIADVEIGVGGRQALVVVYNSIGHGQFNYIQLLAVEQAHGFEALQVLLQQVIVLVVFIFLHHGNYSIGVYKRVISSICPSVSSPTMPSPSHSICSTP